MRLRFGTAGGLNRGEQEPKRTPTAAMPPEMSPKMHPYGKTGCTAGAMRLLGTACDLNGAVRFLLLAEQCARWSSFPIRLRQRQSVNAVRSSLLMAMNSRSVTFSLVQRVFRRRSKHSDELRWSFGMRSKSTSAETIPVFVVSGLDGDDVNDCARAWGATDVRP